MEKDLIKRKVAFGVILIIVGLSFLLNDFIVLKREKVFSEMNLELSELLAANTENDTNVDVNNDNDANTDNTSQTSAPVIVAPSAELKREEKNTYEAYAGVLEIAKINFSKGFYKKESALNNVKFNLKILAQSTYPDEDKGNVIIIGHSGNYSNSYFANLYKLEKNDTASILYNNKKYTYKIVNIYTDSKDGTVTIYRDETKSCLTLITCTKDDDKTQTIYIMELVSVE